MSRDARTVRAMEARTLVPLPSTADGTPASTRVQVLGDRIVVDRLVLHDPSLAASLAIARPTIGRHSSNAPCASG